MSVMRFFLAAMSRMGLMRAILLALAVTAITPAMVEHARAQAIALSVNGDPITTIDLEQRMKLLRALRRPASRDAAVESMISDRLKLREAGRYGIAIKDNEIGEAATDVAGKMKITPQQLLSDIEKSGVQREHYINFFKAELGFTILVKALNKGVEASEVAVRAELAKGGKSSLTQYTIRQVVFTLNPGDSPVTVNARAKEAEALRGKFLSCPAGIAYAKTLDGVAVLEPLRRSSSTLSGPLKDLLDKTPLGHLTPPQRSASGIELVAVCERGAPKDDTEIRKTISDRLLQSHYDQEAIVRFKEMRGRAVIEKR